MKYRCIIAFLALALLAPQLHAGFTYGLGRKHTASIQVPRPPDVFVGKRDIQIIIDNAAPAFTDTEVLKMAIEDILQPEFNCVDSQPEAIFTISIISYEKPVIKTYKQNEKRYVRINDEESEERNVPVEYWDGRAHMNWNVNVSDPAGGLIDSFPLSYSYEKKIETSVNGVATNRDMSVNKGLLAGILTGSNSTTHSGMIPQERDIQRDMLQTMAKQLAPRYKITYTTEPVLLAVPKELRQINELVIKTGNWEDALKSWQAVTMKKKEDEADRLHNIAVAYEALALKAYSESGNPETAEADFALALENYRKAIELDPEEKYFDTAMARAAKIKGYLERAKQQWETQRFEAERLAMELQAQQEAEKAKLAAVQENIGRPPEQDTPEEAKFRNYVKTRIKSAGGTLNDNEKTELEARALRVYKLDEAESGRVITQEIEYLQNLKIYEDDFKTFVADKTLTKEERASLADMSAGLQLAADDVAALESTYKFTDETKTAKTAKTNKKPAAKVAVKAKPAADVATPVKPAAATVAPQVKTPSKRETTTNPGVVPSAKPVNNH